MSRRSLLAALALLLTFSIAVRAEDALAKRIGELTSQPRFKHAHWGILFVDLKTGEVLHEHNGDKLFAPASTTKLYTVATALDELGADYRFETPLKYTGTRTAATIQGDLILVASGDLTFGGRTTESGEIAFTDSDHTYANWMNDATLTPQDPLAGIKQLAGQVAAAGIKRIAGDVLIDDRLFDRAEGSGSGPGRLTPIVVNDNVIDFLIEPTEAGKPANVTVRPQTSIFDIEIDMQTVGKEDKLETWIRSSAQRDSSRSGQAGNGMNSVLHLTGKIPAGREPLVRHYEVPDPAGFARSLLIEALREAGIHVGGKPAVNHPPISSMPSRDGVTALPEIARLVSPPFAENARLILKVSHNLHASTLPLLVAAKHGQRTLGDGLKLEAAFLKRAGVDAEAISFGGGAGGARSDYVTPAVTVQLLKYMSTRPDFEVYQRALPVLGVDGTLAKSVGPESPVRGQAQAKTGTLVWDNGLSGRGLCTSKALAGYLTTKSGRKLAFAAFINGVHLRDGLEAKHLGQDLGKLCEIVFEER
jgi:D-alanyl-D-alanine carboxypeptidase/D-alanyl-D-alanine-endopeptidase (penicillin-binding protein 4)